MSYGELYWLTDEQVKSHANAKSEIARGLFAKSKYLWELATGEVPDGQQCTPRNPQGLVGIDHSGAPWGAAYRHTCTVGEAYVPLATSNCVAPKKAIVLNAGNPAILISSCSVTGKPFHYAMDPAYATLELRLYGKLSAAGAGSFSITLDNPGQPNTSASGSLTVTSTTLKTHVPIFTNGSFPGYGAEMPANGLNRVEFFLTYGGSADFELHGWGFHQVSK